METRKGFACDQCHGHKLRCTPHSQLKGCSRCNRLNIQCTSNRIIQKRGRKAIRTIPPNSADNGPNTIDYPVLDCLRDLSILESDGEQADPFAVRLTRYEACRLLENFYDSPNQEFHAVLIRRDRLLNQDVPRPTPPILLLSILCVACFMPLAAGAPIVSGKSTREHTTLGRYLFHKLVSHFQSSGAPDVAYTLDDGLTVFIMTTISPSEQSVASSLHYWLSLLKFIVQELQLHRDEPGLTEDEKEERRRLWWATYIIDRHTALSFNARPQFADTECQVLPIPCPDEVWGQPGPMMIGSDPQAYKTNCLGYRVASLDMFGIFLPLSRILGEILEHQFLCENPTFSKNKEFLDGIRKNIIENLDIWFSSFSSLVGQDFCTIADAECKVSRPPGTPTAAYYVRMHTDLEWQMSSDFLIAGEHAVACANVAHHILEADPQLCLMYRFFGTYFLQSSFIFLILAQKLGRQSDDLILRNCFINLQVLDIFVASTNMDYQRTFAKVLRRALSHNMGLGTSAERHQTVADLDPEMLAYRWTSGYRGLRIDSPASEE